MKLFEKIKSWRKNKRPIITAEAEYGPVAGEVKSRKRRRRPHPLKRNRQKIRIFDVFGAGDFNRGERTADKIITHLEESRKKFPVFAIDQLHGWLMIKTQMEKLSKDLLFQHNEQFQKKSLDVIATLIRFINKEYQKTI